MKLSIIEKRGTVIARVIDTDGFVTGIGEMQGSFEVRKLAHLLGTYGQTPEACGPLVDVGPPFDDGGLRVSCRGISKWDCALLMASWAMTSQRQQVYEFVSKVPERILELIFEENGRLLYEQLFSVAQQMEETRPAFNSVDTATNYFLMFKLLNRFTQAGDLFDLQDLSMHIDARMSSELGRSIVALAKCDPNLAKRLVREVARLEANRPTFPKDGINAGIGRTVYVNTLNWLQKALVFVLNERPDLGGSDHI